MLTPDVTPKRAFLDLVNNRWKICSKCGGSIWIKLTNCYTCITNSTGMTSQVCFEEWVTLGQTTVRGDWNNCHWWLECTKHYKYEITCFSTKHVAFTCTSKYWLVRGQYIVSEWSYISTWGLLFQWSSTVKFQIDHHHQKTTCSIDNIVENLLIRFHGPIFIIIDAIILLVVMAAPTFVENERVTGTYRQFRNVSRYIMTTTDCQ